MFEKKLFFLIITLSSFSAFAVIPEDFKKEVSQDLAELNIKDADRCWMPVKGMSPDQTNLTFKKSGKLSQSLEEFKKFELSTDTQKLSTDFETFNERLKRIWDQEKTDYSSYPKIVTGVTEVLYHNDRVTDANANHGIKSYMLDSLISEDEYFVAAYRFYKELKQLDESRAQKDYEYAPIQEKAQDLFSLAMKHSGNNPYLASKILATYGHDNLSNSLDEKGKTCRGRLLDLMIPANNSQLYLNGAIGKINYTDDQVKKGLEIAKACNNPEFNEEEKKICNDKNIDYQADYYHVIASTFLGCRQARAVKASNASKLISFVATSYADQEYLDQVRAYKLNRFLEKLLDLKGRAVFSKELISALLRAYDRISWKQKPVVKDFKDVEPKITEREYLLYKATLERFEFEVDFRVYQHKQGFLFGREACKEMGPLPKDEAPEECIDENLQINTTPIPNKNTPDEEIKKEFQIKEIPQEFI